MRVTARFFASHRERVGRDRIELDLPAEARVSTMIDAVIERYPALEATLARARFAVNREYATGDDLLREGDEVAFIPPVAGGTGGVSLARSPSARTPGGRPEDAR